MTQEQEPRGQNGNNRAERMAGALSQYVEVAQPGSVVTLFDAHQVGVVRAVGESWVNHQKGRIKEPTGGGKTVMQAAVIEGTRGVEPEAKTLVVVPRIPLLHQTTAEFRARIPDLNVTHYYGGRKDLTGEVNVTTYSSLISGLARGDINPDHYKLVLYDEAHHLLPARRVRASQAFVDSLHVGFTATPAYGKNRHLREVLTNEISNTSIREAIEANRLCSFSVFMLQTGISLDQVKVRERNGQKEFNDVSLQKAVNVAVRNQTAVDLYQQVLTGRQTVSYCAGVDHARALADLFNYHGIKAATVSGYQSEKVQREIIARYKSGEIQVLCNADILIEGFDDVKTSAILNLRPTLSPRLAEQRGGRALRLDREDRSKYALVVDFIDEVKGKNQPVSFAQVAEAAQIVNTWYESKSGEYVGYLKPVILDLKQAKFITDSREVMWAVNELTNFDYDIEPGWKTLRRISAETGIPLEVLQILAAGREEQFLQSQQEGEQYMKDMTSPRGNSLRHYYYPAIFDLVRDALHCMNYEEVRDLPEEQITEQNLFQRNPSIENELTRQGKYCATKLKRVDAPELIRYAYQVYQRVLELDSDRYNNIAEVDGEEPGQENPESIPANVVIEREVPSAVEAYKEEVRKADGALIPLRRTLPDGKRLFIQARYFDIPESGRDENVDVTSWRKEDRDNFGVKRILLVDVYMEEEGSLKPVGHLDWSEITFRELNQAASARGNMHGYVIPKTDYERLAQERWTRQAPSDFSSWVENDYRRQGIGGLMLATSGVALEAKGFRTFDSGALTDTEARVYRKFDFEDMSRGRITGAPIERLTNNPQTDLAIEKYIT